MDLFLIITFCTGITLINSAPIPNKNLDQNIHGIIVEEVIPENKIYPNPEFVAPLIIEGQKGLVHLTANDPEKEGHVGYVPAGCIKGRLMSLDHFKDNYKFPETVEFKVVHDAQPIFDVQQKI